MDIRLGKFLHHESPWPIPKDGQKWSDLTGREQVLIIGFASRIVDETLRVLVEIAASPSPGFQDVAPHANYWLIELQARRSGELPASCDGL